MNIEKLIERLQDEEDPNVLDYIDDAATALSVLQTENDRLRDEVERQRRNADNRQHLYENAERAYIKAQAELEQVKREKDAAVSDLTFVVNQYRLETTGIDLCGLCEYDLPPVGENGQTAECPGFYVNDCFKWRGPEEG